jgi:hypothetical protein
MKGLDIRLKNGNARTGPEATIEIALHGKVIRTIVADIRQVSGQDGMVHSVIKLSRQPKK